MTTLRSATFGLALVLSLVLCGTAKAVPVTWELGNWAFDDGGTAAGSFVFDADTNVFSDIFIATTNGAVRTGALYGAAVAGSAGAFSLVPAVFPNLTFSPNVAAMFAAALTNAGGTVGVFLGQESTCESADCNILGDPMRHLESGAFVQAVPIPTAFSLFLSGLVAFGLIARRKRAVDRSPAYA